MVEYEIAFGFLRYPAWNNAHFRRYIEIDLGDVMGVRDRGMNFDAIAPVRG